MIGRKTRFVFVHIPKNGGQSISRSLRPYALSAGQMVLQRVARAIGRESKFDLYGLFPGGGHAAAADIKTIIGDKAYGDALSFAVVRNPWDRLVSLYAFSRASSDRSLFPLTNDRSFEDFVKILRDERPDLSDQLSYIEDAAGTIIVDKICRFERLGEDFQDVCNTLGIPCVLPHKNASKRPIYRDLYSDETVSIVTKMFARDIKEFGYEF